jgi:hypothetical protein
MLLATPTERSRHEVIAHHPRHGRHARRRRGCYVGAVAIRSRPGGETGLFARCAPAGHSRGAAVAVRAHQLTHAQGQSLCAPLRPRLAPQRCDGKPRRARRHRVGRRAERHLHARRDPQAADVSRPRGRARDRPHARDVLDQDHGGQAREVDESPPPLLDSRPDRQCPVGRRAVPPVGQTTRARLVRGGLAPFRPMSGVWPRTGPFTPSG